MNEQTCASIVFTPQARVFGISNSVLGQLFYIAILLGITFGGMHGPESLLAAYLGASIMTIGLGIYLTYSLLFVTHVRCTLCFTSHGINLAIFGVLVVGL